MNKRLNWSWRNLSGGALSIVILAGIVIYGGTSETRAFYYPTGVPRCQFTNPITSASHFLKYPLPADYDASVSEQKRVPAIPTGIQSKEITLDWASVVDRSDQISRYDLLNAADGYSAFLSSTVSGSSIQPIQNQPVSLIGSFVTRINNDQPVRYTLTVKKDGAAIASCSVNVRYHIEWIVAYQPPPAAVPTGNSLLPYKAKDIFGRSYNQASPAGFVAPVKSWVGRIYDRWGAGNSNRAYWQNKAFWIDINGEGPLVIANNKVYMRLGSTIAMWNKDSFINKIAEKNPSVFAGTMSYQGGYQDAVVPWQDYFYTDYRTESGWYYNWGVTHAGSSNGSLVADDRGYLYIGHPVSWGILKDDGSRLRPVSQVIASDPGVALELSGGTSWPVYQSGSRGQNKLTDGGFTDGNGSPQSGAFTVLRSGSAYYLVTGGTDLFSNYSNNLRSDHRGSPGYVWDVTDPLNPRYLRSTANMTGIAQAGSTVAVSDNRSIKLYTIPDFVNGLSPQKEFSAGSDPYAHYSKLAFDGSSGRFFSIHYTGNPTPKSNIPGYTAPTVSIAVFSPTAGGNAGSYSETKYPLSAAATGGRSGSWSAANYTFIMNSLDFNSGYLVATVTEYRGTSGKGNLKLWVLRDGQPVELDTGGFFRQYGVDTLYMAYSKGAIVHSIGGKTYLFLNDEERSDVFELEPASPGLPVSPVPQLPVGTSTLPIVSDSQCLQQYQYLCDQVNELTKLICTLVPSACENGVLK